MGKVNVKNGTPVGNAHLCRTCSHGQFTAGYRETDVLVICASAEPSRLVPFPVHECTAHWDRNRPSYMQMQKFALHLTPERRKPVNGFTVTRLNAVPAKSEVSSEGEQKDEAARTK